MSPYVQGLVESGDEGFIAVVETVLVDSLIRLVLVRRLAVDPEGKIQRRNEENPKGDEGVRPGKETERETSRWLVQQTTSTGDTDRRSSARSC